MLAKEAAANAAASGFIGDRLYWGSFVMALSTLLEENILTIAPAFLGSMLVNPGDHRDQRTRLTFCFL